MDGATWEVLENEYKPKALALAEKLHKDLKEIGFNVSMPWDWTDEDLRVSFCVYLKGASKDQNNTVIDVTIMVMDAAAWDGTGHGTNFGLDVCAYGGRIVGSCIPGNYSDDVWVNPSNEAAVAVRWKLFERAADDAEGIADSIREFARGVRRSGN